MLSHEILPSLLKKLKKLSKKDKPLYEHTMKKIDEIISSFDIEHNKNLRYDLKDLKRVHIGNFVLVFEYNKKENKITFKDHDHHDSIYKNRQ